MAETLSKINFPLAQPILQKTLTAQLQVIVNDVGDKLRRLQHKLIQEHNVVNEEHLSVLQKIVEASVAVLNEALSSQNSAVALNTLKEIITRSGGFDRRFAVYKCRVIYASSCIEGGKALNALKQYLHVKAHIPIDKIELWVPEYFNRRLTRAELGKELSKHLFQYDDYCYIKKPMTWGGLWKKYARDVLVEEFTAIQNNFREDCDKLIQEIDAMGLHKARGAHTVRSAEKNLFDQLEVLKLESDTAYPLQLLKRTFSMNECVAYVQDILYIEYEQYTDRAFAFIEIASYRYIRSAIFRISTSDPIVQHNSHVNSISNI